MRLPSFNDLIPEQMAVFEWPPDDSMLVVGPPGSGKTSMAIWRARLLVGPSFNRRVILVTRNRLLASVAAQLARENEGANIVAATMNSHIARQYYSQFGEMLPQLASFSPNWDVILQKYEHAKSQPTFDHMIIDEGQNLPPQFFQWAVKFGAQAVSVFADEAQATLGVGTRIADLQAAGFNDILALLNNHRNTAEIANIIAHFHSDRVLPQATPKRGGGFDLPRLMAISSWRALADIVTVRLSNRRESIGVIVFRKDEVTLLASLLRQRLGDARVDAYTSDLDAGEEGFIRMREHGVTVLSGESAIGLEFDTLYLQDLSRSLPTNEAIQKRRLYMLCARARDNLILVNGPEQLNEHQLSSLPSSLILER